jgi:hypothetical protein
LEPQKEEEIFAIQPKQTLEVFLSAAAATDASDDDDDNDDDDETKMF